MEITSSIASVILSMLLSVKLQSSMLQSSMQGIPRERSRPHDMDRSILAESVELYAADKAEYPIIRIADVTGSNGKVSAGVLTSTTGITLDTTMYTPDTCQAEFDGTWYNVTAVTALSVTLQNPPADDTTGNKAYVIRFVNKISYPNRGTFQAQVSSTDNQKVTIKSGLMWPINVQPGVQIKFNGDTKWYNVASRYSDTIVYLDTNVEIASKDTYININVRQNGYVQPGSYVYPWEMIPLDLQTKIRTDIPNVEKYGDGVFEIVDMKRLVDNNYITKTSDKGFACYDSNGNFSIDNLDSVKNKDHYLQIYIRHSTTGMIYYMQGVKAENGIIKY